MSACFGDVLFPSKTGACKKVESSFWLFPPVFVDTWIMVFGGFSDGRGNNLVTKFNWMSILSLFKGPNS